jgi:hypothetical protein
MVYHRQKQLRHRPPPHGHRRGRLICNLSLSSAPATIFALAARRHRRRRCRLRSPIADPAYPPS